MVAICTVFVYLFLFYLTALIACMICFCYNVCDCHSFITGNLLTYLLAHPPTNQPSPSAVLMEICTNLIRVLFIIIAQSILGI